MAEETNVEEVLDLLSVAAYRVRQHLEPSLAKEIEDLLRRFEPADLRHGLYRIHWKSGGASLASVGLLEDGRRWFAPINWSGPKPEGIASCCWHKVERIEKVLSDPVDRSPSRPGPKKFKDPTETLAELAREIDLDRRAASRLGEKWVPSRYVCCLYRLVDLQLDHALETGDDVLGKYDHLRERVEEIRELYLKGLDG
jgi:hypothetical protein